MKDKAPADLMAATAGREMAARVRLEKPSPPEMKMRHVAAKHRTAIISATLSLSFLLTWGVAFAEDRALTISTQYVAMSNLMLREASTEAKQGDKAMSIAHYKQGLAYGAAACSIGSRTIAATLVAFAESCVQNDAIISQQTASDASDIHNEALNLELGAQRN
jgi:hypothetical protein